jgi:hypothetical protein
MAIIIPKSWNNISVDKFLEIYKYKLDDFDSENLYYQNLLSILSDIPIEQLGNEMYYEDFVNEINDLFFITQTPYKFTKPYIQIDDELTLHLIDYNRMTLGEFIDLENMFVGTYLNNFKLILSIVYRQRIKDGGRLFLDEYEPYGNYIHKRESLFGNVSINEVYGVIISYFKFRDNLYKVFEGLFNMNNQEEEVEEDLSGLSRADRLEVQKEIDKEKKIKIWGWDIFLYKLANNDPTKLEEATNMPLVQALNVLSMKKELNLE